jgi:putative ABC transport system permease protein
MMGAALILQTLQVRDGLDELIVFTFDRLLVSDVDVTFDDELDYGALLEMRRMPGVDHVEPMLRVACTFEHGPYRRKGAVTGILPTARLTIPRDPRGRRVPLPDHGLVLTNELARILHVSAGDTLTLVPLDGERRALQAPVRLLVESFVGTAAYADFHYLNRLIGEEAALNSAQALVAPAASRDFYRALKQASKMQGFAAIREQRAQLLELLQPITTINSFLIAFAGLLCAGGIMTATLISLAERRQEIATFRVLGYHPHQIGGIFLRETLLVNSVGILLGLPVGYLFSRYVIQAVATETTRLPFVIDRSTWLLAVLLSLLFTLLAYLPVYRAVKKLDWLEALNVKE